MEKLNIAVCVKQTVDKDINPFDACALEAALSVENAEVTAVCMGPASAADMLARISRLGVKKCVLVTDPLLAGSDTLVTAYALSLAMKHLSPLPDMIFCGRQSIDGDTAQVGPELATALGYNLITNVLKFDIDRNDGVITTINCTTRFGEETQTLPCLLTIERINTLRFPRLGSKPAPIETWNCADIGAEAQKCGLRASPTKVLKTFESSLGKRKCSFMTLSQALEFVREQASKERVSPVVTDMDSPKLPLVWCVGNSPVEKAKTIAEEIRIIDEKLSPVQIAQLAKDEKPEVILWSGDFLGRRNAPQMAYLLSTGLCADCTALETDGKKLYMYRPAFSGSIMAKIECKTMPQMATVRSSDKNTEDIIVAAGLGAAEAYEQLHMAASENGFGFGATRALVDKLSLPYEYQIGLTGRSVCPKVYICAGVSGAVQHTCAIEQAGCIVAINTDKSARIFDYADVGVIADAKEFVSALEKFKCI